MKMKKLISLLLVICIVLSMLCVFAGAKALPIAGDVNADGKVTPYDALQVQAYLHGEISLTESQIKAAVAACPSIEELSSAHIIAIFFKPLTGKNEQAPEADGLYHINNVSDLALLRSFPYAGFSLDADLDLEGTAWTPFIFNGYLFGNNHTISNISVSASTNNVNAGALFTKLGSASNSKCAVSDLTLENVSLITTATHTNVGIVCGSNYGKLSNVSLVNTEIKGAINSTNKFAGAQTGVNYGSVVSNGTTQCNIGYAATNNLIVGKNEAGATSSYSGNVTISQKGTTLLDMETRDPELMNRQTVIQKMYDMSQIRWYAAGPSLVKESDCLFEIITPRWYVGMPYSHMLGSIENLEANTDHMEEDVHYLNNAHDVYIEGSDSSPTANVPTDRLFLGQIIGADCSSALISAWRTVCTNITAQNTNNLVPIPSNCSAYGIVKIGNYEVAPASDPSKVISSVPAYATCWDVNFATNKNLPHAERNYCYCSVVTDGAGNLDQEKLNTLYEAYALCQPGDAIDAYTVGYLTSSSEIRGTGNAGHARLVSAVPVVVRDADGKIDPEQSYLTTIEQGGGGGSINKKAENGSKGNQNAGKYSSWGVNMRYTFKELVGYFGTTAAQPHYSCYVPVTCAELNNQYRAQTQVKLVNSTSPVSGVVSSNYGIIYTEVTIDGQSDKQFTAQFASGVKTSEYEAMDDSGVTTSANKFPSTANRCLIKSVNLAKHASAFSALASGTHTYTVTVKLTTGEFKTYSGTYTN